MCPVLRSIAFFNCEVNTDCVERLGEAIAKRRGPTAARVVIVVSTAIPPDLTSGERLRKSAPCMEVGVCDELPGFSLVWLFHV